ncbi:MAG: hypothetical protein KAS97_00300, partial [Candidatus Aminicenantes bacterium]|nr:hypothetical protein [Candidatus Aminicenantes bacterium]
GTGMGVEQLYNNVMDDLDQKWALIDKELQLTDFQKINISPRKSWTQYTSPKEIEGGYIVAQKYGLSHPLSLVKISPEGDEKKITEIYSVGHINNSLSVNNNKIVWSEPVKDLRWGKRSYSEVILYDIHSRRKKRLTKRTRYFSPALSPDGKLIAVIRFSKLRRTALVIIRSSDGNIVNEYESPFNSFLLTPSWDEKGDKITLIRMENGRKAISLFDMNEKTFTDVSPLSNFSLSTPVFFNEFIIFNSSYSGIDNIYAVDISSGSQYKITSSRFGAFFPSISTDMKRLIYSEYDLSGMNIVSSIIKPDKWIPLDKVVFDRLEYFKSGDGSFKNNDLTEKGLIPGKKYRVRNYSSLRNIVNFHSRVIIPDRTEPVIEMYSGNKLNSVFLTTGFSYNTNEIMGKFYTEAVYAGMFPVITAGLSHSGRRITDPVTLKWSETTADLSFLIPLNLSRGVFVN